MNFHFQIKSNGWGGCAHLVQLANADSLSSFNFHSTELVFARLQLPHTVKERLYHGVSQRYLG
jgi:hypothetical protein